MRPKRDTMAIDLDLDGVARYEPGEMDVVRPAPGAPPTRKSEQVSALLGAFKCFGAEAVAAALSARPPLPRGAGGGGRGGGNNNNTRCGQSAAAVVHHQHHRHVGQHHGRDDDEAGGGAPWQRACSSRARGNMRQPTTTCVAGTRPQRLGGTPSGARALMGALNKLNERNFEPIKDRVIALVAGGDVSAAEATRAVLSKSADESCFAHVYVKLLQAARLVCRAPEVASEASSEASEADPSKDAAATEKDAEGRRVVSEFLGGLFGGGGDAQWADVRQAAIALGACGPAPAEGTVAYDAFCVALKIKKRLLGRHRTALAVLSAMARDIEGAPRPAEVVAVTLKVLGSAANEEDEGSPLFGTPAPPASPAREAAVDLALDLATQVVEALAKPGAPPSHNTALAAIRAGASAALSEATLAACYGSRTRFKVAELLNARGATLALPKASTRPTGGGPLGGGGRGSASTAHPHQPPSSGRGSRQSSRGGGSASSSRRNAPDEGGWRRR